MLTHVFKTIWMAIRSFSLGLLVGLLIAPHAGTETRRIMRDRLLELFDRVLPTSAHARTALGDQQGEQLDKQGYWQGAAASEAADQEHNTSRALGTQSNPSH